MCAAGEGDEGTPAALEDWRDFRARMVALERMEAGETLSVPGGPSPNKDGLWAHVLGAPEKGSLLVAQPQWFRYSQQYFFQAVILLVQHDENGSLGVILNRPTGYKMSEVSDIDPAFGDNKLYLGGDVGSETLIIHPYEDVKGSVEIVPGVYSGGLEQALHLVRTAPDKYKAEDWKFFTGYAGWGPGQLNAECTENVWWPIAASNQVALKSAVQLSKPLWSEVLELCGGDFVDIAKEGRM